MSDVRCYSKQFITEFIELYKSLPCLWKVKSRDYGSRTLKSDSYQKMVEKLKEVEPNATRELVIRKINSLRTTRRKEWKKIRDAAQSGCVYKPVLWYFDALSFIDDHEASQLISKTDVSKVFSLDEDGFQKELDSATSGAQGVNKSPISKIYQPSPPVEAPCLERVKVEISEHNFSSEDDASETNSRTSRFSTEYQDAEHEYPSTSYVSASTPTHPRPPKRKSVNNSFDQPNVRHCDDRFEIFAKSVAIKMRDLPTQQRLIAEKIINDTLFKAEMGTLKLSDAIDSKISND